MSFLSTMDPECDHYPDATFVPCRLQFCRCPACEGPGAVRDAQGLIGAGCGLAGFGFCEHGLGAGSEGEAR